MRVSLGRVLSWVVSCSWLQKNPCAGVKLPRAGTKVIRTILKPEQTRALASNLEEPYATLVLFLAVTGLRISEAIGIKWSDFDGNVLHISRRIYEGRAGETKTSKSVRSLPIPEALAIRMRKLGEGQWVFRSRVGTTSPTRCYEMLRNAPRGKRQSKLSNSSVRGWSREWELNPRPADYESAALPLSYLGP
jgi:integrase